jgi:ribosomal protein S18 acetylase RimI-like enzyme
MVYDAHDPQREADHWVAHEQAMVGLPVPAHAVPHVLAVAEQITGELAIVHAVAGGNDVLRRLAWDAAMLAGSMDRSKTMFDGGEHDLAAQARAIMALVNTPTTTETGLHVVGLLVTRRKAHRVRVRWRADQVVNERVIVDEKRPYDMTYCEPVGSPDMIEDPACSIDYVWTHRAHRRRGIARALVDAAILSQNLDVNTGLTWMHPFLSSAGASLAHCYNEQEFWLS